MDPINYNVNVPNPIDAFQSGMMGSMQINAAKTAMANQAEDRQKAQLQAVWAAKSAEEQASDLRMSGQMLSALNAKDSGAALSIIDTRLQALKNSGNEKHAADLQNLRDIVEKHPESAAQSMQYMLSTVPGGEKIIESLGKVSEEGRKAAMAPGELEKQTSEKEKSAAELAKIKADTNRINADIMRGSSVNSTANKKDWDEYQRLLKIDPEQAAAFGRAAGFVSTEGQKLSDFNSKAINAASTASLAASNASSKYTTLADQIRKTKMTSGLFGSWNEALKKAMGSQEEVTSLRQQAMQVVNSEAINALPPGPATDRDISLARAPFPADNANGEYVANWLESVARLSAKKAEFEDHKANFIAENGGQRDKNGGTIISTWKAKQEEQAKADKAKPPTMPATGSSRFKIEVVK